MEEEFVSYGLALELKKLGFNEDCLARWDGGGFRMLPAYDPLKNSEIKEPWFCVLPLWQQAFNWFREKHRMHIEIYHSPIWAYGWKFKIYNYTQRLRNSDVSEAYSTYEETRTVCLEKLIKNEKITAEHTGREL